ncbi:19020_t:CDS:1, partial [Gigaspora rosea]
MGVDVRRSINASSCRSPLSVQVAISPDSEQIVTFNPNTLQINVYDTEDLKTPKTPPFSVEEARCNGHGINWSLAISNPIYNSNSASNQEESELKMIDSSTKNDRLIALSKISSDDKNKNYTSEIQHDLEKGDFKSKTWIISLRSKKEIKHSIGNISGIVRFLDNNRYNLYKDSSADSDNDNSTIVIINSLGIFKSVLGHPDVEKGRKASFWYSLTNCCTPIEEFYLPKHLLNNLSQLNNNEDHLDLLHSSIVKNHLFVHYYKNKHKIVE